MITVPDKSGDVAALVGPALLAVVLVVGAAAFPARRGRAGQAGPTTRLPSARPSAIPGRFQPPPCPFLLPSSAASRPPSSPPRSPSLRDGRVRPEPLRRQPRRHRRRVQLRHRRDRQRVADPPEQRRAPRRRALRQHPVRHQHQQQHRQRLQRDHRGRRARVHHDFHRPRVSTPQDATVSGGLLYVSRLSATKPSPPTHAATGVGGHGLHDHHRAERPRGRRRRGQRPLRFQLQRGHRSPRTTPRPAHC